jgi:hypothetical protein
MNEIDDTEIESQLRSLRYRTPPFDEVWAPDRITRRRHVRLRLIAWIAVAAALTVTVGVVAGGPQWFEQFAPITNCATGDLACGSDSAQVAILVDKTTDVTAVNILVKRGLSRARLTAIAAEAAAQQKAHRVIVYLLKDLPVGPMTAGFAAMPTDDAASPPPPLAVLRPFLLLTYDRGPSGATELWP